MKSGIKILIMLALGFVFIAALVFIPRAAAHAADTRPCVSKAEFNSTIEEDTRGNIEDRWEVKGVGVPAVIPGFGHTVLYPRCGAVKKFPDVFYGALYELRGKHQWLTTVFWDAPVLGRNGAENTDECATSGEFAQLQGGMTRHEVYTIMDGKGVLEEPQVRQWTVCPEYLRPGKQAVLWVWFKKQKVVSIIWYETWIETGS